MSSLLFEPESTLRAIRRRVIRTGALLLPAAIVLTTLPASGSLATRHESGLAAPIAPLQPPAAGSNRQAALRHLNLVMTHQNGRASAVILDTSGGIVYQKEGDQRYQLASVSKLYILTAYLDLIERQDREANDWEREMMAAMIEESDNRSAADLWDELGEVEGVQEFLKSKNLRTVEAPEVPAEWGEVKASALDVGILLRELYDGRLLSDEHTRFALDLLGNIIDEQAWGVGAAQDGTGARQTYLKNGWYPEEEGWTVNSAGIVDSESEDYVVVLLTDSQPSLEEGVSFIESAVRIFQAGITHDGGLNVSPTTDLTPPVLIPGRAGPADIP